ncbi:MAG: hypothetical protein U5J64_03140 [Halobacteriales archaeon]|nr:hypothetical protein [Halobacteriales archaeon]
MGKGTRDPDEIEERIADILGYCRSDGELHDPRNFVEKYAGMRWKCPDCDLTISKISYKRAKDLKWVITPHSTTFTNADTDGTEPSKPDTDEKTSLLDNVQKVQDSLLGDDEAGLQEQVEELGPDEGNSDAETGSAEQSTEDGN